MTKKRIAAYAAAILTLLLLGVQCIYSVKQEQTVAVPFVDTPTITVQETIITGICTFGDCPVATTLKCTDETDKAYETSVRPTETEASHTDTEPVNIEPSEEDVTDYYIVAKEEYAEYEYVDNSSAVYSAYYFKKMGLINWGGWTWSWYSEYVLPGSGLNIPGRHSYGGYVRDGDGYICLASDVLDYGTVVATPFGSYGKVYDCGVGHDDWIDVYVSW